MRQKSLFNEVLRCPVCGMTPAVQYGVTLCNGLEYAYHYRIKCCTLRGEVADNMNAAAAFWNEIAEEYMGQKRSEWDERITVMEAILSRGNDVEIRSKKDGIQIIEISKKTRYST